MTQSLYQYQNCYGMLEEIRTDLNEYSDAKCKGTDISGIYDNTDIVRKLNNAQRFIWGLLFARTPELFLTSATVTGSGGAYTIPSRCFRLSHITDSNGNPVRPETAKVKKLPNGSGSPYLYYRMGSTIWRDDGNSDALTFYYYKQVCDLVQGCSRGGSSTTITLDNNAKKEADYYNSIIIENITDGWADTITDYSATRVCTLSSQRGAAQKYYGTVSELPEPFHPLITQKAILLMKNSTLTKEKPTQQDIADFNAALMETLRAYTGTYAGDAELSEIFYNFEPYL